MISAISGIEPAVELAQYRAIGFVQAKYEPSENKFYKGTFITTDSKIPGGLNHALTKWLQKNEECLGYRLIWRVYPIGVRGNGGLSFEAISIINSSQYEIDCFSIRGKLFKWDEDKLIIKVKRNFPPNSQHLIPNFLEIRGQLPGILEKKQFWELKCLREVNQLKLVSGRMILDAQQMKALKKSHRPAKSNWKAPQLQKIISTSPSLRKMTTARAEITLKFNTIPKVREIGNKKVELDLLASNGVVFTIALKGKSWRKAQSSMVEYADWIANVSGKLGNPTDRGFEVLEAGIQVFEKQSKEVKPSQEKTVAVEAGS